MKRREKKGSILTEFLETLGFSVESQIPGGDLCTVSGSPSPRSLATVKKNFATLENSVAGVSSGVGWPSVLKGLKLEDLKSPKEGVRRHESGIYDSQFAIWTLQEIALEDQNNSIINKCVLPPSNIERFINFLVPRCSRDSARIIHFDKLSKLSVIPLGILGNRKEVLNILSRLGFMSDNLFSFLSPLFQFGKPVSFSFA